MKGGASSVILYGRSLLTCTAIFILIGFGAAGIIDLGASSETIQSCWVEFHLIRKGWSQNSRISGVKYVASGKSHVATSLKFSTNLRNFFLACVVIRFFVFVAYKAPFTLLRFCLYPFLLHRSYPFTLFRFCTKTERKTSVFVRSHLSA